MDWNYARTAYTPVMGRDRRQEKEKHMKTYIFNVSLEPDEDGWRAFYPPLEQLGASTWGKTQEEAREHINAVLSMIVEEFIEEGRELPVGDGMIITEGAAVAVTR
jgi:predicted RNase H-like HicB family nuclease